MDVTRAVPPEHVRNEDMDSEADENPQNYKFAIALFSIQGLDANIPGSYFLPAREYRRGENRKF